MKVQNAKGTGFSVVLFVILIYTPAKQENL